MRLSDIINTSKDAVKRSAPQAPKPRPSRKPSSKSKSYLYDDPAPRQSPSQKESEMRERLEQEFRDRMEQRAKAQEESKSEKLEQELEEVKKREAELRTQLEGFEKSKKDFEDHKKKIEERIDGLLKERDDTSRVESEEREKIEAEFKDRLDKSAALIKDLQEKVKQQAEAFTKREQDLESAVERKGQESQGVIKNLRDEIDLLKAQATERPAPTVPDPQPPKPKVTEGPPPPPKPKVSEKPPTPPPTETPKKEVVPPRQEVPPPSPTPPPIPKAAPPVFKKPEIPSGDQQLLAKGFYDSLVDEAKTIFEQYARNETLNIDSLILKIKDMVEKELHKNPAFISLVYDPYPEGDYFSYHAVNCTVLCSALSGDFALDAEKTQELALAAMLHDIGLVNVKEDLDYPKEISRELRKEVENHPERSAEILAGLLSEEALDGIKQHHEGCNGMGYPNALKGPQICLYGKIISLVDSFEAMTHKRPYRNQPMSTSAAVKSIITTGRHFHDKTVMKSMMNFIGVYPVQSRVELSNKKLAKVLFQNPKFPLSPIVEVEFDEWGRKMKTPEVVDLSQSRLIHIVGPLKEAKDSFQSAHRHRSHKTKKSGFNFVQQLIPIAIGATLFILFVYFLMKV